MPQNKPLFSNKQLFTLIWPLLIEQLLTVLVGMVDVLMVASVGESAVSGVSLVDSINILIIQILAALTSGGTVVCSRYIGMKKRDKVGQTAAQLISITLGGASVVMIIFLLGGGRLLHVIFGQVDADVMADAFVYMMVTSLSFPFLALYNSGAALFRAIGDSKTPMKVSMLMNGLNVIGNAICIFGLHMGVSGVAIPTLIARAIAAIVIVTMIVRMQDMDSIKHKENFRPNRDLIGQILSIGIPGGMENGMFQFGKLMLQSLVATLGTASIAGFAVASNLVTFLYLPGNTLGIAMVTIVGQCIGAGEIKQAKSYIKKLLILNYMMLAVICSVLIFGRGPIVGTYQLSTEAAAVARMLVLTHSLAMIIWPPAFLLPHGMRAGYDAKFTMEVSVLTMWSVRVGGAYLFVKGMHFSVQSIWYAMYIDWGVRIVAYLIRFRSFDRRVQKGIASA